MHYISLPFEEIQRLSFYLAQEEYIARYRKEDDCFFMWQVEPSVIFGRNQLIENEVNLAYCKEHNIQTYRRKSGGGCVYADKKNIMFSYINTGNSVSFTFDKYIRLVTHTLKKLGLDANTSGRNDILIGNKKVSGNAFYHLPGRNIVHGTMLYDTDMQNMIGSITPSDKKLISKGVKSVRQHITLLKDHIDIDIETFKMYVRTHLCDSEIQLTTEEVQIIREIEKEYLSPEFIYGNNPRHSVIKRKRIEGCGEFEVQIELKNNIIKSVNIMGDYFLVGDLDNSLLPLLYETPYTIDSVSDALKNIQIENYIHNLNKEQLLTILF